MREDGFDTQQVACRLGIVNLRRQVCYHQGDNRHTIPGNELLPEHNGTIITRNLQEMACLFSKDLPFATTQRLLGWQTQEAKVLSTTELRQLVRRHGQQIRRAEAKQVEALSQLSDLRHLKPILLVPENDPRRAAALPAELTEAVQQALDEQDPHPPEGVKTADW